MQEYVPVIRKFPNIVMDHPSAWGDISEIIFDITERFGVKRERALEFGVEWGYSTSVLANYFEKVVGVDTFEGDIHSNIKQNHFGRTSTFLGSHYPNIELNQSLYQDWIKGKNELWDLIHVDIVHDYEHTFDCGEWAVQHAGVCIFHDTISFSEVMRACQDLVKKYDLEFWNYPYSNGLGILVNRKLLEKKYTIGWISHSPETYIKYLGASLAQLKGNYDVLFTSDVNTPAVNYNDIISRCKTRWLILLHEDVAFSDDLLERIDLSIESIGEGFNFLGIAGPNALGMAGAKQDSLFSHIETIDSCFIVLDTHKKILFDSKTFDDFHCYVEDYCIQTGGTGHLLLSDCIEPQKFAQIGDEKKWIHHGGATYFNLGSGWGKYWEYKKRLDLKYGREILTT